MKEDKELDEDDSFTEEDKRVLRNFDKIKKYMKEKYGVTEENIDEKLEEQEKELEKLLGE